MKPTLARLVLYTNLGDRDGKYPPESHPAIITGVNEKDVTVSLHVFYKSGQFDMESVEHAGLAEAGSEAARGKWQWPTPRTVR